MIVWKKIDFQIMKKNFLLLSYLAHNSKLTQTELSYFLMQVMCKIFSCDTIYKVLKTI